METTGLRKPVNLSLTPHELEITSKLKLLGYSYISIFRRGLKTLQEEEIDRLTQNNIS